MARDCEQWWPERGGYLRTLASSRCPGAWLRVAAIGFNSSSSAFLLTVYRNIDVALHQSARGTSGGGLFHVPTLSLLVDACPEVPHPRWVAYPHPPPAL